MDPQHRIFLELAYEAIENGEEEYLIFNLLEPVTK